MKDTGTIVCVCLVILGCANGRPIAPLGSDGSAEPRGVVDAPATDPREHGDVGDAGDATMAVWDVPGESTTHDAAVEEIPANPATWTNVYNSLLNNMSYASNCTGEGCHSPGTQGNLDLSTQANGYATVQAKLVPGSAAGSTIVNKLESGLMPRGRPRMPPADLDLIKAWILAGAPDD